MKVYVETNFLLELAFEQEQHAACEELLQLAETSPSVRLAIPVFSLYESMDTLQRRRRERNELGERMHRELREFRRNMLFTREDERRWSGVIGDLALSSQSAEQQLVHTRERLRQAARLIPLTVDLMVEGARYHGDYELSLPDAMVLASVLHDTAPEQEPACFLNRNVRDFDEPEIAALLKQRGCKLIGRFDNGLAYVQNMLRGGPK